MHEVNNVRRKTHRGKSVHPRGTKATTKVHSTQAQHRERDGWRKKGEGRKRKREGGKRRERGGQEGETIVYHSHAITVYIIFLTFSQTIFSNGKQSLALNITTQ